MIALSLAHKTRNHMFVSYDNHAMCVKGVVGIVLTEFDWSFGHLTQGKDMIMNFLSCEAVACEPIGDELLIVVLQSRGLSINRDKNQNEGAGGEYLVRANLPNQSVHDARNAYEKSKTIVELP